MSTLAAASASTSLRASTAAKLVLASSSSAAFFSTAALACSASLIVSSTSFLSSSICLAKLAFSLANSSAKSVFLADSGRFASYSLATLSASSNFFLSSADGVLAASFPASSGVLAASSKNFVASAAVAPFLKASSISALFAVAASLKLAIILAFCSASF